MKPSPRSQRRSLARCGERRQRRGVADIPLVDLSKALSGIGNDPRLISVTAGENCPRDAGKLISERDCQHVAVKPLRCLLDPGPQTLPCRPWPPLEDNVCGLHEQCPYVFVAALVSIWEKPPSRNNSSSRDASPSENVRVTASAKPGTYRVNMTLIW